MTTPTEPAVMTTEVKRTISAKVIGLGGAGGNAVHLMAQSDCLGMGLFALNTDAQALDKVALENKLILGSNLNHGLGAGGDPERGRAAAQEDMDHLRAICKGADIIFILAGLGGGTGTGAAPVLAQAAKESGALVLAVVTLPFEFEGGRRQRQAQLGFQQLKAAADAVICLPNEKMFKLLDEKTGMGEAFKISNDLLAEGVRGVWRLLAQTGLINVDFADLCSVTRGRHAESSFASAEATGEKRPEQIIEKLLSHPLLDGGQMLNTSDAVLVSVIGGSDLTMNEVNKLMEQINRQCENAHLILGAAIDEGYAGRLSVTLIATRKHSEAIKPIGPEDVAAEAQDTKQFLDPKAPPARTTGRYVAPPPALSNEKKAEMLNNQGKGSRKKSSRLQPELALEIVSKGRFEKSEPTVRHGEDLDIPTYIRRCVALN